MAQRTSSVAGEGSYLCLLSNEREVSMPNIKITDWLKKRAYFICKLFLFVFACNEREFSMLNIKITDWLKKRAFFICKLQLFFPWPRELRV